MTTYETKLRGARKRLRDCLKITDADSSLIEILISSLDSMIEAQEPESVAVYQPKARATEAPNEPS